MGLEGLEGWDFLVDDLPLRREPIDRRALRVFPVLVGVAFSSGGEDGLFRRSKKPRDVLRLGGWALGDG